MGLVMSLVMSFTMTVANIGFLLISFLHGQGFIMVRWLQSDLFIIGTILENH